MCQMGSCSHTAVAIIVSPETGEDVAVCTYHIPENAETFPIGQEYY